MNHYKKLTEQDIEVGNIYLAYCRDNFFLTVVTKKDDNGFEYKTPDGCWSRDDFNKPIEGVIIKKKEGGLELCVGKLPPLLLDVFERLK